MNCHGQGEVPNPCKHIHNQLILSHTAHANALLQVSLGEHDLAGIELKENAILPVDRLGLDPGNGLALRLSKLALDAKVTQDRVAARIKGKKSLANAGLERGQGRVDLYYYYISQDVPAARKKTDGLQRQLSPQGLSKAQGSPVVFRLLLKDDLAAGEGLSDRDFHIASLLQNLAAPIEKAEAYDPL
ncbi:Uncharacterised protein [uncultured archaeon]|nr:Uncharacterised protein [uncultured archaeon]